MYELACRSIGVDLAVLPYHPASNCDRWLLKMHGCVSHPDDIVLTRVRLSLNDHAIPVIVCSSAHCHLLFPFNCSRKGMLLMIFIKEHYMRYQTRRSALSGIVQSLLITRHMLFVGFSLKDDNFHRIVDVVWTRTFYYYYLVLIGSTAISTRARSTRGAQPANEAFAVAVTARYSTRFD